MSLLVGDIVLKAAETHPDIPGHVVASCLAIIVGAIICFLGLIRCGWIVELISLSSVCSFVTGAAFNIAVGQIPKLMGISGVDTRSGSYISVIQTLQNLGDTKIDAALGLTALLMLYIIRFAFTWLAKKQPHRRKTWFFCSTLRTAFVILLYTLISWLMNLHLPDHDSDRSRISIIGDVPRGFTASGKPQVTADIITSFAGQLPAAVIVLLIEHISIAKSFGRVNGYKINPSQELVAIGVSNLLGPFLGGYPATGSFSRTAIKSKAGVRTPLAGVVSAVVVLLAIYALPAVFFYIPNAALAAVIIHAVLDLLTPASDLYRFWKMSPLDALIFVIGVFVITFSTVEYGIYVTVSLSFAVLVFRFFKAKGDFLAPVPTRTFDTTLEGQSGGSSPLPERHNAPITDSGAVGKNHGSIRNVFLPIEHTDWSNPDIKFAQVTPGVFIYRFAEELCYVNASRYMDGMANEILDQTRMTAPSTRKSKGDRMWNDTRKIEYDPENDPRPTLKAIILDFSSVHNLDLTTMQALIDVRAQLNQHTAPYQTLWYFANVKRPWAKRALMAADFGFGGREPKQLGVGDFRMVYDVAELRTVENSKQTLNHGDIETQARAEDEKSSKVQQGAASDSDASSGQKAGDGRFGLLTGMNRPCFFTDLESALRTAAANAKSMPQ